MPLIRPISDLMSIPHEISAVCHEEDRPVFITKEGKGDLVVMSHAHDERLQRLLDLYQKLSEAESLDEKGEQGISHEDMMNTLRRRLHE